MATPMSAAQFVAALIAEGVHVVERPGWTTHNRNHMGAWGPVHGVMIHHTVSSGELSSVELCEDGYAELPGPLCQSVIGKSGYSYMVGNGRCNHAGKGDSNVFEAVKDERYGDVPPATHVHDGMTGGVDGNAHFYGAECVNLGDGKDLWPAKQVDAMVRWAAAICRFHGWTSKSVIGHSEWSDWKNDPRGPGMPSMTRFRELVQQRLDHEASWSPDSPAAPTPTQGTPDVPPHRTILSLDTAVTLLDSIPKTIYWTTEHSDDGQQHGAGGKTVISNGRYTAVFNATFEGLKSGENVEVWTAEENTDGQVVWEAPAVQVHGTGDGTHPVKAAVPFIETTYNRLVFVVKSSSFTPVTMTGARVSVQSWPN